VKLLWEACEVWLWGKYIPEILQRKISSKGTCSNIKKGNIINTWFIVKTNRNPTMKQRQRDSSFTIIIEGIR
jgi:hypothetical protein